MKSSGTCRNTYLSSRDYEKISSVYESGGSIIQNLKFYGWG